MDDIGRVSFQTRDITSGWLKIDELASSVHTMTMMEADGDECRHVIRPADGRVSSGVRVRSGFGAVQRWSVDAPRVRVCR